MPKYYSKSEYIAELERNNRELRAEITNLNKVLEEKQRLIDSIKSRQKRSKLPSRSDKSCSSVGTIQNLKSEKPVSIARVLSIKEGPMLDVSVSSTGSDIKRRLQHSLKIYPSETHLSIESRENNEAESGQFTSFSSHREPPNPQQQITSTWVTRAPHLAHVMSSYKPEEKPAASFPQFPPLFSYMPMNFSGPFSHPSTNAPSHASTPTAVRTPQQQSINWQIPAPVLFGLGGATSQNSMYITRPPCN